MQTKHLSRVLIQIWTKCEVGAPWNRLKPSSKIFYWLFQGGASYVDYLCVSCLAFVMLSSASDYWCFVVTCWERADILAHFCDVYCEVVTFPLVSWVRCGAWLYRFLIFVLFLTFIDTLEYQIEKKKWKKISRWPKCCWLTLIIPRSYSTILI